MPRHKKHRKGLLGNILKFIYRFEQHGPFPAISILLPPVVCIMRRFELAEVGNAPRPHSGHPLK
jgi:hypothetical protein